jgi:hypothetical protein
MRRIALFIAFLSCIFSGTSQTGALTSSNLPIIVIQTHGAEIVDEPKIQADMGIVFNGDGIRNRITDPFNHYNGKIGIEIRGQSSQMFPMKSYSIELWDAGGNSVDRSLFGLPKESDWVLYAPYTDKTLMRNVLAYSLSRGMGRWAANCRYVELVVNGDYKGIYVFMERIKRGSGRVPVTKMAVTDVSGDAVTGGYIFSIDKDSDGWYSSYPTPFTTLRQPVRFGHIYPKKSSLAKEQEAYLKSYVDSFENALQEKDFQLPERGWRRFADEGSFIDYMIVNEVSRNVDGYRLSAYFHKDRTSKGGKIVAGPVWDYDLAFRNANYCRGSDPTGWCYEFNRDCPDGTWHIPQWWYRFNSDSVFLRNLRERWKVLRNGLLSQSRIDGFIDSVRTLTAEARSRHFQRWPILGQYVWPNPQPIPSDYDGEITALKGWLQSRITWLDGAIASTAPTNPVTPNPSDGIRVTVLSNPVGNLMRVRVTSDKPRNASFRVLGANGQTMMLKTTPLSTGDNEFQWQTSGWPSGVYALQHILETGETGASRFMKR